MKMGLLETAMVSYVVQSAFLEQVTGEPRPSWYEISAADKEEELAAVRRVAIERDWEIPSARETRTVPVPESADSETFVDIDIPGYLNTELMLAHLRAAVVRALK